MKAFNSIQQIINLWKQFSQFLLPLFCIICFVLPACLKEVRMKMKGSIEIAFLFFLFSVCMDASEWTWIPLSLYACVCCSFSRVYGISYSSLSSRNYLRRKFLKLFYGTAAVESGNFLSSGFQNIFSAILWAWKIPFSEQISSKEFLFAFF